MTIFVGKADRELEKRVAEKRELFLSKIKELGLKDKIVINKIMELSISMEKANILGEKELALHYKNMIKKVISKNLKRRQ